MTNDQKSPLPITGTETDAPIRQRLTEIRGRLDKATTLPWWQGPHYRTDVHSIMGRVAVVGNLGAPQAIADAEFIAHAREDIPYLLDQLAAAEARASQAERERDAANLHTKMFARAADTEKAEREIQKMRAEAAEARADLLQQERDELLAYLESQKRLAMVQAERDGNEGNREQSDRQIGLGAGYADVIEWLTTQPSGSAIATPHGGTDTDAQNRSADGNRMGD